MPSSTQTLTELTREQVLTTLVQPLTERSVFLSAGPHIVDTPGPLRIPFAPEFPDNLTMTGENELIPEVEPEVDDMQLLPSTMKSFKVLHRYSNEAARQSFVALDSVLRSGLVASVASAVDKQLMGATGDGITAPRGLGAYQGVQTLAAGGDLTVDKILAAQGMLLEANASTSGLVLFVRVADYMKLRAAKDTTGAFVLAHDVNSGNLVVPILGARVIPTNRIAEGTAYLAHMPSIIVARDVLPSVRILTETFGNYDQIAIRVVARLDAAPLRPEAIVRFTGVGVSP